MTRSRILIVGDSHTGAIHSAFKEQGGTTPETGIAVYRLTKIKNGTLIGDVSLDDFQLICGTLDPQDLVVSVIGGNQHAAFSLIQHDQPFDVLDVDGATDPGKSDLTLLPRNTVKWFFERGMRGNDVRRIKAIAASGKHRTIHLSPPPPKADTDHILRRVETDFAARGITEKGVSPAPLRHRIWALQNEVLQAILAEDGIDLLPPPDGTMTPDGFLHPDYYARDATHANAAYGTRVLDQVRAFADVLNPAVA